MGVTQIVALVMLTLGLVQQNKENKLKKILLTLMALLITSVAHSQCVAEVKDVIQDEIRGSIITEVYFTLNGEEIKLEKTRYDDTTGTNEEIINKVKADAKLHCENIILRMEKNKIDIISSKLSIQKEITLPIVNSIKNELVGYKISVSTVKRSFKGKEFTINANSEMSIKNIINTDTFSK